MKGFDALQDELDGDSELQEAARPTAARARSGLKICAGEEADGLEAIILAAWRKKPRNICH
jgi:hypothetical protein